MGCYTKKKRITFVIGSMGSGGAERVISILANNYAEKGWSVDIIMLLNNKCYYKLNENIRVISISNEDKSRVLFFPKWIQMIRKYIKINSPDIVVSFIARINIITIISSLGLKCRVIISERTSPRNDGRSVFVRLLTKILYPSADRVIFQTESAKTYFSNKIQEKSLIIPNPVSVNVKASDIRKEKIVSVGRLRPEKNHHMLLKAFYKLKEVFPEYNLYIYGEGPLRSQIMKQIQEYNLSDSVFLPGNVTNIHERICDSEIFVLPSQHEGLSNALIEAMMMGLACISTNYEGASEIIKDGVNGLLVPLDDEEQMYIALHYLVLNKETSKKLGKEAKKSVEYMKQENILSIWENAIENK